MVLPGPAATRLVDALATVASAGLGRWALVGGLAVHVRLGTVEVLPAAPATTEDLAAVPDLLNRLFAAGLSWALDTATPVQVTASFPPGSTAVVPVATPGALVVMKLHAILDRRGPGLAKRASDSLDLYQLLLTHGRTIAIQLAGAPEPLRADAMEVAGRVLIGEAHRTIGWMRQGSGPAVGVDELRSLGRQLLGSV